jgi:hypothetical protein
VVVLRGIDRRCGGCTRLIKKSIELHVFQVLHVVRTAVVDCG